MFKTFGHSYTDFSSDLRDPQDWNAATLKTLTHCLDAVAVAVDPVSSLLAIGTMNGVIHILGAPGVETEIRLPTPTPVKFLEFATNIFKLLCIDENDKLYLWDLTHLGQIKLDVTSRLDRPVTYVSLSPSHTHAFISLESGQVKTYDFLCRRMSSYIIPNAWELYEQELKADGMLVDTEGTSRIPVQLLQHPRNLNLIFIAYGGGVALIDLKDRNTLRTYELLIPAGAPGGAGYADPDLLKHRRPSVTSITIHPSGHLFAVGHLDGSVAFWAVEDDSQPLLVRTLDDVDVHVVDGNKLDEYLPGADGPPRPHEPREPIFKLAWSGYPNSTDPRGGETSLIILGGQFSRDPSGINVLWLPAFNPPEPPAMANPEQGLHPHFRNAMRVSLDPVNAYFYSTSGLAQDFTLIPRSSPHFSGMWDPKAVLLLSESEGHLRAIEAYQFPPPAFFSVNKRGDDAKAPGTEAAQTVGEGLAAALQDMTLDSDPMKLALPPALWNGPNGVVHAQLFAIDRFSHETLSQAASGDPEEFRLDGGVAVPGDECVNDVKLAKFETPRIVISRHRDHAIRFLDISVQLLVPSPSSQFLPPFPHTLPWLDIYPLSPFDHPAVAAHMSPDITKHASVQSVQFADEALEVSVVFTTGHITVYRLASRVEDDLGEKILQDDELVSLEYVPVADGLRFKPFFMVLPPARVSAYAASGIGFCAVAYSNGTMFVIDMRGPKVMFRLGHGQSSRTRHSILPRRSSSADPITSFTWTICSLRSDPIPKLRLIAIRLSAATHIYTLDRTPSGAWIIPAAPIETETIVPLEGCTFILDARTGGQCKADRSRLSIVLGHHRSPDLDGRGEEEPRCFLVVAGSKGARCYGDLDGDGRVSKTDWGSKAGLVRSAQIVEKNGSHVLLTISDKNSALVYSLPSLDQLHTVPLPTASINCPSLDTTGDVLTLIPAPTSGSSTGPARRMVLDTFFNVRRGYYTPLVWLTERRDGAGVSVPSQPYPVSMGPAGWLSGAAGTWLGGLVGTGGMSGAQIDALLAGPDRPIPVKSIPQGQVEKMQYVDWEANKGGNLASSAAQAQSSLYGRLQAAVAERGEMLGGLETSVNSLEEGSRNMVDQAKRLAAQQSAKGWFNLKI